MQITQQNQQASPSSLRQAALALSVQHDLGGADLHRLRQSLGLGLGASASPLTSSVALPRAVMVLAAALCGLGLLMWMAANWNDMPREARFALLQAMVVVMATGAWRLPRWRAPLGLLAFVSTGGLFAFFGMTYQTGADPWQLFALWAALTLPLALAVRSDVVWAPWVLVAMVGVSLWTHTQAGFSWWPRPGQQWAHMTQHALVGLLVLGMGTALSHLTGVGLWGRRTALVLWLLMLVPSASFALWQHDGSVLYAVAAAITTVLAWWQSRPGSTDVFGLSAVMLGANVLLLSATLRVLIGDFKDSRAYFMISITLLTTLIMAAALTGTARWIMSVAAQPLNAKETV
jgi:uncharacterized membrane protein